MFFRLGELDQFPDGASQALQIPIQHEKLEALVVRQGEHLFAYLNRCPHTGAPLNWNEHQFLTRDAAWIQCAMHGALFNISTGQCVAGPCAGDQLYRLSLVEKNGEWFVEVADGISELDGSQ